MEYYGRQESSDGCRKDEARLSFLQYFITVGWVTRRAPGCKDQCHLSPMVLFQSKCKKKTKGDLLTEVQLEMAIKTEVVIKQQLLISHSNITAKYNVQLKLSIFKEHSNKVLFCTVSFF